MKVKIQVKSFWENYVVKIILEIPFWKLLWGVSAVLYQTGIYINTSVAETKRLCSLFRLLHGEVADAEVRKLLTQSCVNMVLPTRDGQDQDLEITRTCFVTLLAVIESEKADTDPTSAHTLLIAIKVKFSDFWTSNFEIFEKTMFWESSEISFRILPPHA